MFILRINFYCFNFKASKKVKFRGEQNWSCWFSCGFLYLQTVYCINVEADHLGSSRLRHVAAVCPPPGSHQFVELMSVVVSSGEVCHQPAVRCLHRRRLRPEEVSIPPAESNIKLLLTSSTKKLCAIPPPSGHTMRMSTVFDGCYRRLLYDCMYDPLAVITSLILACLKGMMEGTKV